MTATRDESQPGSARVPSEGVKKDDSALKDLVAKANNEPVVAFKEPEPDIDKTARALESLNSLTMGVWILAVLALIYTIYFAREFLLPIVFAMLLNFLLSPLVRLFAQAKIDPPLGAGIIIIALLAAIGLAGYELAGPVQRLAASAPHTLEVA